MTQHGKAAREYFLQGYNCTQSLAAAFAPEMGLEKEMVVRLTCGFGGGVSRLREVCGAFSGMVFVVNALYATADPRDRSRIYAIVQQLSQEYSARNGRGSIVCRDLLGLSVQKEGPQAAARTAEYYRKRPCADLIALCGDILEEYIQKNPPVQQPTSPLPEGSDRSAT